LFENGIELTGAENNKQPVDDVVVTSVVVIADGVVDDGIVVCVVDIS